jgi:hypothetical protein
VGAENCGTFVANVLQANGIKGIDTQKIYSVFKKPQEQGVSEGLDDVEVTSDDQNETYSYKGWQFINTANDYYSGEAWLVDPDGNEECFSYQMDEQHGIRKYYDDQDHLAFSLSARDEGQSAKKWLKAQSSDWMTTWQAHTPNAPQVHESNELAEEFDLVESIIEGLAEQAAIAIDKKKEKGVDEVKQRLDPKCWKGKHKEGTKIKGGVRVNNCVPNESIAETPIDGPNDNPMIYGHQGANPAELKTRIMRARGQIKDLSQRADTDSLLGWESIARQFPELAMNIEQIRHAIEELAKKRKKGGIGSRGIDPNIGEEMMPTSNFAGSKKKKLGSAGQLKATAKHAKAGDLVGGSAEESYDGGSYAANKPGYSGEQNYTAKPNWRGQNIGESWETAKANALSKLIERHIK